MTNKLKNLVVAFSALMLPLTACATAPTPPIEGKVIEEGTNKPISGAIVVARWQETRSGIFDSQTVCVHVESATTDTQGRYQLPRYKGREPGLTDSYKAGYERSPQYFATQSHRTHTDILKPSSTSPGARLEYLSRMAVSCSHVRDIEINLLPLYKALYREAQSIATTREQKLKALYRLRDVERLELGTDKAWENFRRREKELQ